MRAPDDDRVLVKWHDQPFLVGLTVKFVDDDFFIDFLRLVDDVDDFFLMGN